MGNTGSEKVLTSWGKRRRHIVRGITQLQVWRWFRPADLLLVARTGPDRAGFRPALNLKKKILLFPLPFQQRNPRR